jgi:hypothetical protein
MIEVPRRPRRDALADLGKALRLDRDDDVVLRAERAGSLSARTR